MNLNTIKKFLIKEKYMFILSTIAYYFLLPLTPNIYNLGAIGIGMLMLTISNKIKEENEKKDFFILLLVFLIIGFTHLIKINEHIYIKILFSIYSIFLYILISLGSKKLNISVKGYIRLLIHSFFITTVTLYSLVVILFLLNFVNNSLFNFNLNITFIFRIINSYYFLFFNYTYEKLKINYISNKDIKEEGKIILGLLDLLNIGVLIIFIYIIKIILFNEYPTNILGRLIPLFYTFAVIKILLIKNYSKLKLEKIIWYTSPILLFYFFNSYYKRIEEYGLTENRLWMVSFGVFILLTSIFYFTIKNQNIKLKTIILTFLVLINLNINLNKPLIDKYKKTHIKNEATSISRFKTINCINQFELFKKSKIYFRSNGKNNIRLHGNFFLKRDWVSTEIYENSELIFSTEYLVNKNKLNEKALKLLKSDMIKIFFNDTALSYFEFIKYLNNLIIDPQLVLKNAYLRIDLDKTIIILPINSIFIFSEKDRNKIEKINFEDIIII